MVSADSQGVSVTGHLPYGKLRVGNLHSGSQGACPSVDSVEAVSVHVVRETAGASDA